jgi:ATP-binding cassette subfamily F protein uup
MKNIENALEKLKPKVVDIQNEIDNSSDEGWTVLAELTETLDVVNEQIDEKELRWLELAEALEESAAEELV